MTLAKLRERYLEPRRVEELTLLSGLELRVAPDAALDVLTDPIIYAALTGSVVSDELIGTLLDAVLH